MFEPRFAAARSHSEHRWLRLTPCWCRLAASFSSGLLQIYNLKYYMPVPMPRKQQAKRPASRRVPRPRRGVQNPTTQRVAAAVAVGSVFRMPSSRIRSLTQGAIEIHNKEIVASPVGTATAGDIPFVVGTVPIDISDSDFNWLVKFTTIYDKYCFKSIKITWVPTLPTTTSGSVAIYFDSDETAAATSFVTAATNDSALVCPVFETCTAQVPKHLLTSLPWYSANSTVTGPAVQGTLAYATTGITLINSAAAGSVNLGYIMLEYVVHLKNATSS